MPEHIQPDDWFAGLDFATDVYTGKDGAAVRNARHAGASPEADLLDRRTVPATDDAYRRQLEAVFGPREDLVIGRLASHAEAQRLVRTWSGRGARGQGERLFEIMSGAVGDVFGFTPAPLSWSPGLPADNAIGLFLRGAGWERVVLSIRLLHGPPLAFLDTVIHEQTHRLQHALTSQLNTPMRPLEPLERGLVLYWLRKEPDRKRDYARAQAERDSRRRMQIYRAIPIEHHAYTTAERTVRGAFPGLIPPPT